MAGLSWLQFTRLAKGSHARETGLASYWLPEALCIWAGTTDHNVVLTRALHAIGPQVRLHWEGHCPPIVIVI